MKYVYHGSKNSDLKVIKKNKSTHNTPWVYGTYSKALSLIFISSKGNDLYYYLGGDGSKQYPYTLVERKEGMFKEIFSERGTIYYLSNKNFISGKTGWSAEVVSEYDEPVIKEERIDNVYDELIKLNDSGEIKVFLYPNRPEWLPIDNSDLISKVKKWESRGFDINIFFEMYPELKEKYLETR